MPSAVVTRKGPYVPELLVKCITKFKHFFILSESNVPLGLVGEMLNTESFFQPIVSKNILLTVTK